MPSGRGDPRPFATGLNALTVRDADHAEGRFLRTPACFVPLRGAGPPAPEPPDLAGLPPAARGSDLFRFLPELTAGALGPREAYGLRERESRPQRERCGLTPDAEGGRAWPDDPGGRCVRPLPALSPGGS